MTAIDGNCTTLTDEQMRELGFTDHREGFWFYSKRLISSISFTVTIDKATGDYSELVEDTDFGQPAFYGNMREPYRTQVHDGVERQIEHLAKHGIVIHVDHTQYRMS